MRKSVSAGMKYNLEDFGEPVLAPGRCLHSSKSPLGTAEATAFDMDRIFGKLNRENLVWAFDTIALVSMSFAVPVCLLGSKPKPRARQSADQALAMWLGALVRLLSAIVLPIIIVLHEMFLLKRNTGSAAVSMTEGLKAFEQWSRRAATGLVIAATVLNWMVGERKSKQASSPQLYGQRGSNDAEKTDWSGILGKPVPAVIR